MQPSDNVGQSVLEAVAHDINELEHLCLEIDASIGARDWNRLGAALANSRRVTHSLQNVMAEASPYRTPEFDKAAFARLHQIYAYRQERMDTLQAIHDDIGGRLRQLSQWKGYARAVKVGEGTRRSAGLDSRR